MLITVELKGPFALRQENKRVLQVPRAATVREIIKELGIEEKHVGLVVINGNKVTLDTCLNGEDNLVIFPVVAGG